jgi:2-polyprenyl-3-methyl-5-hydroxy-6-metoxy-1,4-benzoquinol methylase
MDDPALAPASHAAALAGLARINRISRSVNMIWRPIRALARAQGLREVSVLDVATASGDVPVGLYRRAQRDGLALRAAGIDRSPTAIGLARERAHRAGAAADFQVRDALGQPLPEGFDVVTCSLFLHHLAGDDAVRLLRAMAAAARQLVVVSDLARSSAGYAAAWVGTRVLTRSSIVHTDGPLSVRAAFTPAEAAALALRAGLHGAIVRPRYPFRWLLTWSPP